MTDKKKAAAQREAALKHILESIPGNDSGSQRARLLLGIQTLGSVSSREASRFLDCYHPPARIHELRGDGQQIITVFQDEDTESGVAHRIGVYFLHTKVEA